MKDAIRRRLERLVDRCDEVGRLLAEPDAAARPDRFRELSVEYARLEPVAAAFRAWLELERQLESVRGMASDPDPGVRELAAVEVEQLSRRVADEETALQWALVPPDPQDESNVFLEIRAAAGGDEAAIFAGDLFEMYRRYCERNRFKLEVMEGSGSEQGGFTNLIRSSSSLPSDDENR